MAILSDTQMRDGLSKLPGWSYQPPAGGKPGQITRQVATGSFLAGLGLVTRVAVLAEKHNHHPDVVLTYPRVTLSLTTHDAGGVTAKDLALAAEINALG